MKKYNYNKNNKNKKLLGYIILSIVLIVIALYVGYTYPRSVSMEYQGIRLRLDDPQYKEKVAIRLEGHIKKQLFAKEKVSGKLFLDSGEEIVIGDVLENKSLDLYTLNPEDAYSWGVLYSDEIKDGFAISIFADGMWTSAYGEMVIAPASNRKDAINLANRLMKDIISKPLQ